MSREHTPFEKAVIKDEETAEKVFQKHKDDLDKEVKKPGPKPKETPLVVLPTQLEQIAAALKASGADSRSQEIALKKIKEILGV